MARNSARTTESVIDQRVENKEAISVSLPPRRSRAYVGAGILVFALGVAAAGYSSFFSPSVLMSSPAAAVSLSLDDRSWKLAHTAAEQNISVAEYVPEGSTLEEWKELVTVQSFPGFQNESSIRVVGDRVKSLIKSQCPDNFFDLGTAEKNGELFYEWYTAGCPGVADQHEIVRVVRGKDALFSVHYAVRQALLADEERQKWVGVISAAVLPE